ncbi:hypothetical protein [Variovorax paradoxus]|uniref:hypothetical protein n=1 Tax=Variovorax paradoxus TaxID=34073 RepID=UPI001932AF51|nr:hypothetical protein INQ48_15385 [Variovorax paradoxus]
MPLVLGVMGLPPVEVELLRIIVRLSSNLRSRWTVSESQSCDLLLIDGDGPAAERQAPPARFVVPMVARRGDAAVPASPSLARPIYAEEVVELLNRVAPNALPDDATQAGARASLTRWPSQATLQRHPAHVRLAAALSRSAQSAESLGALGQVDVEVCRAFLRLLAEEGALAWATELPGVPGAATTADARQQKQGLLSRIRRRLGLS